ncbi:MAG: site-specific integrase, partial [Gammaproteobacteria bacterium]|nr:site-specific integrase [Gammaproteobacteria bacterium]
MATIEQRRIGDGRVVYRVKVRLKGHPQATATFERKTDAKKWAQDTESDIRRNRYFQFTEAKRHTVGEMIDRYLRDELPQKRSQRDTVRQLKWWDEQIGGHTLADASPALIAEYRDKLAKSETLRGARRSPSTVNRYLAALSHAFTVAVKEWQWLDANPLTKVRKSKEPRGRTQFLSEEERKRLLEACKRRSHSLLYPVVVLALSTGARKGELLALRWRDIDLK